MKLGQKTHLGAESQSEWTIQLVPEPWKMVIIVPRRRRGPPAPMNHVQIFKGWPPRDAPSKLVQLWYKTVARGANLHHVCCE